MENIFILLNHEVNTSHRVFIAYLLEDKGHRLQKISKQEVPGMY